MVALSGQPARGRGTLTATPPPAATWTDSTMPRSVIGRRISGSLTVASAALICSRAGEVMPTSLRGAPAPGRRTRNGRCSVRRGSGGVPGVLVLTAGLLLLELLHQGAQLRADVVTGAYLA